MGMTPKEHYLEAEKLLEALDQECKLFSVWTAEQHVMFTAMGRLDIERAKLHIELGHSEYLAHEQPSRYA